MNEIPLVLIDKIEDVINRCDPNASIDLAHDGKSISICSQDEQDLRKTENVVVTRTNDGYEVYSVGQDGLPNLSM